MFTRGGSISIQEYWKRVREIQRDLPEVVRLVSVPDDRPLSAGQQGSAQGAAQFVEVDSLGAAKLLFAGTHRLATPEECAQQVTKRETDIRERARRHLASQGIVAIQLPSSSK